MKIIIAGGRDFVPMLHHAKWLNTLQHHQSLKGDPITEVVTGGCRGADEFGKKWATIANNIPNREFKAAWNFHGPYAGPERNAHMAAYLRRINLETEESVAVVLFPGGRGTQSMFDEAKKQELPIIDWRERQAE